MAPANFASQTCAEEVTIPNREKWYRLQRINDHDKSRGRSTAVDLFVILNSVDNIRILIHEEAIRPTQIDGFMGRSI